MYDTLAKKIQKQKKDKDDIDFVINETMSEMDADDGLTEEDEDEFLVDVDDKDLDKINKAIDAMGEDDDDLSDEMLDGMLDDDLLDDDEDDLEDL